MFAKIIAYLDAIALRLWPSTQGELNDDVYADLIAYMYACRQTILMGALGLIVVSTIIAYENHITSLYYIAWLYVAPVSIGRYIHADNFHRLTSEHKRKDVGRHEARYAVITISYLLSISFIATIVMIYGDIESKYIMTLFTVGNALSNSARNASMPMMVRLQTYILVAPCTLGLLFMPGIAPRVAMILVIASIKGAREIEVQIKKDTLDARHFAKREQQMARFDDLTGLANRRFFNEKLSDKLAAGENLAILYMDIDRFKAVNDTQGHPAGDELLILISKTLLQNLDPEKSILSRFGGDEFVIMTAESPQDLAERITSSFKKPFILSKGEVWVGCSIGISTMQLCKTAVDLVKNADLALYAAKTSACGSYCVFDTTMADQLNAKTRLEINLHRALDLNLIAPDYQPIVDMRTGKIIAAEALARWTDSELGVVPPKVFIKIAETTGVIEQLSEALIMRACHDALSWNDDIKLAINISALQFKKPERLKSTILEALRVSGLPGHRLELEITEGTMIDDFDLARKTILELKALGIRVALDDFGTGFSSLAYLEQIPFDKIKIDRALMLAAMKNKTQEIVIRMVTQMALELESETVVEGIEDHAQLVHMLKLGVDCGQGYLFGRPTADQSIYKKNLPRFKSA